MIFIKLIVTTEHNLKVKNVISKTITIHLPENNAWDTCRVKYPCKLVANYLSQTRAYARGGDL